MNTYSDVPDDEGLVDGEPDDPFDAFPPPAHAGQPVENAGAQAEPFKDTEVLADPAMVAAAVAEILGDVADLKTTVNDEEIGLITVVAEHGEVLTQLMDMLTAQPGGPWHWGFLDVAGQRKLWGKLGTWVEWLESRYLVHLPSSEYELAACWWRHPVAVELLTALMVAHLSAYSQKATVPSFTLVDWHLRALEPVFATLKSMKVFKNCVVEHTEGSRSARHDRVAFAAWVDEAAPGAPASQEAP